MMKAKVLIPQPVAGEGMDYLREQGYEPVCLETPEHMRGSVQECDAILLRTAAVNRDILEAGKKLRIVARHGAGFDNVDIEAAAGLGIWVTNAPLATTCSVAEHTITSLLMLAKRIPFFVKGLEGGNFSVRMQQSGMEVEHKVLGVIGLGRIGRETAKKAMLGLGMRVSAYDPLCPVERMPDGVIKRDTLEAVLEEADFVTLHIPALPGTKKMFGAAQLKAMKPTAYVINCARGEAVDEEALVRALREGTIAGAAIDVYDPEPPSMDNPLFKLSNVICTPHIASNTVEANARMALHAAQEIHRVLSGEPPLWPVNKPVFAGH
jgi:D-3-phosphoglycerate dehydrogenase